MWQPSGSPPAAGMAHGQAHCQGGVISIPALPPTPNEEPATILHAQDPALRQGAMRVFPILPVMLTPQNVLTDLPV